MSAKTVVRSDALKEDMKNCLLYGYSSDNCPCCRSRYDLPRPRKVNMKKTKAPTQELAVKSDTTLLASISAETLNLLRSFDAPPVNRSSAFSLRDGQFFPVDASRSELRPIPPTLHPADQNDSILQGILYLASVQKYINKLGFCREGEPKLKVDGTKSIRYQMETAKQIIKVSESIKCHQALVLGIYFTNSLTQNERFTISFRYAHKGKEYTHVVLGFGFGFGHYGAIGISRHHVLQNLNRPFGYLKISGLINAFKNSYKKLGQILLEVKIGDLIPHDPRSLKHIGWSWWTLGSKMLEDPKEVNKLDSYLDSRILGAYFDRGHAENLALRSKYPYYYSDSDTSSASSSTNEDYAY